MPLTAVELVKDTLNILYRNLWPLILIFALTDLTMFALHRVSHRITNEGDFLCIAVLCTINQLLEDTNVIAASVVSGCQFNLCVIQLLCVSWEVALPIRAWGTCGSSAITQASPILIQVRRLSSSSSPAIVPRENSLRSKVVPVQVTSTWWRSFS